MPLPLIGVLELTSKYRYGFTSHGTPIYLFKPYDTTYPEYIVGSNTRDVSKNQIAIVDIGKGETKLGARPRANLIRLIGPVGDFTAEKTALLLHYSQNPKLKTQESDDYDDSSLDEHRITLSAATGWYTYHVDPPGCRDIDDAIAYNEKTGETAITIADVSTYVRPGSDIDKTAKSIGATFYDLEGSVCLPMLPASISEDKASLIPGTKRRGLSLIIDEDGKERFVPTWIIVENSYTYDTFPKSEKIDSHEMIEMLMIRYNSSAATLLKKHKTGLLRAQGPADVAEVAQWTSIDPALEFFAREAAQYIHGSEEDTAHASLGITEYCHASSPIRRYADLVNQRILKSILMCSPEEVEEDIDIHLNARMKANRRWARDLTFLTHVTPGKVHQLNVVWISDDKIWVPEWAKIIRAKHQRPAFVESDGLGQKVIQDKIAIYCDPTKRCWKDRVLTASI